MISCPLINSLFLNPVLCSNDYWTKEKTEEKQWYIYPILANAVYYSLLSMCKINIKSEFSLSSRFWKYNLFPDSVANPGSLSTKADEKENINRCWTCVKLHSDAHHRPPAKEQQRQSNPSLFIQLRKQKDVFMTIIRPHMHGFDDTIGMTFYPSHPLTEMPIHV